MTTPIDYFDYNLPKKLIAQKPIIPRESARLLVLNRSSEVIMHKKISDIPYFLKQGDVVVINNTKVFKARLFGYITLGRDFRSKVEILLIRPVDPDYWLAIGQPGRKFFPGREIIFNKNFSAEIIARNPNGSIMLDFHKAPIDVICNSNKFGSVPVPQYIKKQPVLSDYQTSYAKITGSVAAPTAGFHLTDIVRNKLKAKGITICEVTLHIGLGTFMPIKTGFIENHIMHSEWVNISQKTANIINQSKRQNRRIIAIGTTSVRSLEGVAGKSNGILKPFSGDIDLYITPGFKFQIINSMLTNFHLPKSTLLILVSAFAGRNLIMKAYHQAIYKKYRFYSFGDAMLII